MEVKPEAEAATTPDRGHCALARILIDELRGPLTTVRMGAELLTRSDLSQPQSRRIARNVLAAATRIEELLAGPTTQPADSKRDPQCDLPQLE